MIDTVWLKDFAFRCSRHHALPADLVDEARARVTDPTDLVLLVGGLAQICADLTIHAYAATGLPRPEYFTVGGPHMADLPEQQPLRDRIPHYSSSQIIIALCNNDRSIATPLIMAACVGPDRPAEYGFAVARATMAQLHTIAAHFTAHVRAR